METTNLVCIYKIYVMPIGALPPQTRHTHRSLLKDGHRLKNLNTYSVTPGVGKIEARAEANKLQ